MRDRGMASDDVRARLAAQITDEERAAVADVLLDNEGSRASSTRRWTAVGRSDDTRRARLGEDVDGRRRRYHPPREVPRGLLRRR